MRTYVRPVSGALTPSVVTAAPSSASGGGTDRDPAHQEAEQLARYRLIIEEGPGPSFIYKTMDRVTGEVVRQFPRKEVLKLKEDPGYASGAVIDTTA